jgi:hypothetical protein
MVHDHIHHKCKHVGKSPSKGGGARAAQREKVFECGFERLLVENRERLDKAGIAAGSPREACLKQGLRAHPAIEGKLFEHVKYWTDNWAAGLEAAKDTVAKVAGKVLETVATPVALAAKIIAMFAEGPENYFKKRFDTLKGAVTTLFSSVRDVLETGEIGEFTKRAVSSLYRGINAVLDVVPGVLKDGVSGMISLPLGGALAAAMLPLHLAYKGMKALLSAVLKRLVDGVGRLEDAKRGLKAGLGGLAEALWTVVKVAAPKLGGVMSQLLSPQTRQVLEGLVRRGLDVAGRLQQGSQRGLALVEQVVRGTVTKSEALARVGATVSSKLDGNVARSLVESVARLVEDRLNVLLAEPARKLVGKALALLTKLLDAPRNALVGAIGSIPFVGGILSAGANFGIGIVVDLIQNAVTDWAAQTLASLVSGVVGSLKQGLQQALQASGGLRAAGGLGAVFAAVRAIYTSAQNDLRAAERSIESGVSRLISALPDPPEADNPER